MEESKVEDPKDSLGHLVLKQVGTLVLNVCIICGNGNVEEIRDGGDEERRLFGRFLREVLELDKDEKRSLEAIERLRVCGACGDVIKVVMERKEGVGEVEERVRQLQREVEEEKGKLERRLEEFWREMRRIEEIVNESEGNLEGSGERLEGNGMVAVKILRDSIRFVAQDLQEKRSGRKNVTRRKSKRLKRRGRKRYFGDGGGALEDVLIKVENEVVRGEGGDGAKQSNAKDMKLILEGTGSEDVDNALQELGILTEIKEEPLEKETEVDMDEPMGTLTSEKQSVEEMIPPIFQDEEDDDDFEPEVISENIMVKDKFMGHSSAETGRLKRKRGGDGGDEVDNDDIDNLSQSGSMHDLDFSDSSDTDFFLDEDDELIGSESESSSESSSSNDHTDEDDQDDGENYGRKKSKNKLKDKKKDKLDDTSKKGRKSAYTKAMSLINFQKMSKLKRKLIQRIIHKKFRRPTRKPKTPGKAEVADPRLLHFLEYDSLDDTLSLEGVPIYIHESKDVTQDDLLILECGECGWRAKPAHNSRHPVDSFMYNHVAGQHLNLFQCVQCGSNLGGFKQYSDHVLGHRMGFACDVCGRPLGGAQALARHKWSHLNEEEAGELVRKGLKDPREKKESSKCWTCENCGKIFPQRCQLRKHEKVHLEVRERITCEICGKLFLPSGFISHKRYYCFAEGVEQPRISCPVCPKVFKNKQFMQVHMDRAHNEERRWKCGKCGKGFKTKKDLMTHEETHTTERAFVCKKGCGRTYKTRKNCNAHEKRCDGRGGILIQRFLDAGDERPFSCRKGCGRAYKTRRTLRGHEKTCHGNSFVGDGPVGGALIEGQGEGTGVVGGGNAVAVVVTPMTVLGAALQASMDVGGGSGGGSGVVVEGGGGIEHEEVVMVETEERIGTTTVTIMETVPIAVATETVVTRNDY